MKNYLNPDAGVFRNEHLRKQQRVSEMGQMGSAKIEADLKHLCSAFDENVQADVLWHDSAIYRPGKAPLSMNLTVPIFEMTIELSSRDSGKLLGSLCHISSQNNRHSYGVGCFGPPSRAMDPMTLVDDGV